MEEDSVQLGGHIVLKGFNAIEKAELVVAKKIIGSYARKFSDNVEGYESLEIHLKEVHKTEASEKYEIHTKIIYQGKVEANEVTDRNLFVALDSGLKKLESVLIKN